MNSVFLLMAITGVTPTTWVNWCATQGDRANDGWMRMQCIQEQDAFEEWMYTRNDDTLEDFPESL